MKETNKWITYMRVAFAILGVCLTLFLMLNFTEKAGTPLKDFYTNDFIKQTGAQNAVAGIYLNYRMFDTIFEALMLLVSVMEVINISWANTHKPKHQTTREALAIQNNSDIITRMMGIIYPFVMLIGIYIIINGHNSPGGGFQGGTILATALITRYLVYPNFDINLKIFERLEKIFFVLIVITPVLYLFIGLQPNDTVLSHQIYMIVMNILIGIKVFSGLSIIFYRFVFFEGIEY